MKTISFYSYKGGVGRTTLMSQIARLLAALGKKVVAMDFDFDAPGITAAFNMDITSIEGGLFELLMHYNDNSASDMNEDEKSAKLLGLLKSYLISINGLVLKGAKKEGEGDGQGYIKILPSGKISNSYWNDISDSAWTKLLAASPDKENSFAHFVSVTLKRVFEDEMGIDYLLIDARSGITHYGDISQLISDRQAMIFCPNNETKNALKDIFNKQKTCEGCIASPDVQHPQLGERAGFGLLRGNLPGMFVPEQPRSRIETVYVVSRMPPELNEQKEKVFSEIKELIESEFRDHSVFRLHSDLETHLDPQIRQLDEKYLEEKAFSIVQIHEDILSIFTKLCPEACPECPECSGCPYDMPSAEDDEEFIEQKKRVCALWYSIYGYPFSVTRRNRLFTFLDGAGEMHNTDNERNVAFKVKTFLGFLNNFHDTISDNLNDEKTASKIMNESLHNAGVNCGTAFGESIVELLKATNKWGGLESNIKKWCEFDTEAGFGLIKYYENKNLLTVKNLFILNKSITGSDKEYSAFFTGYAESVLTELANGYVDSNGRATVGLRAKLNVNKEEIQIMDATMANGVSEHKDSNIAYDIKWVTTTTF